jgi:hypothetical protein
MRLCLTAAVVWMATTSPLAAAEEKSYDLRGPEAAKGMTVRSVTATKVELRSTYKENGMTVGDETSLTSVEEEKEATIEETDHEGVLRFTSRVVKDERTDSNPLNAGMPGDVTQGALTGLTVVSERSGKEWTHTLAEAPPTNEQTTELLDWFGWDIEREYIPAGRHAVGKTWEVDKDRLNLLSRDVKFDEGHAQGTFAGVKMVDGDLCAILKLEATLKSGVELVPGRKVPMTTELKLTGYRSLAHGVLVRAEGTFEYRGSQQFVMDGSLVAVTLDVTGSIDMRAEVKK